MKKAMPKAVKKPAAKGKAKVPFDPATFYGMKKKAKK